MANFTDILASLNEEWQDGYREGVRDANTRLLTQKAALIQALKSLNAVASELCTAIDLSEEDIGGFRNPNDIIRDLGIETTKVDELLAELGEK